MSRYLMQVEWTARVPSRRELAKLDTLLCALD